MQLQGATLESRPIITPCLINKGENPLLSFELFGALEAPKSVTFELLWEGKEPILERLVVKVGEKVVGESRKMGKRVTIELKVEQSDTLQFVVYGDLKANTPLTQTFGLKPIILEGKRNKWKFTQKSWGTHRLGVAVRDAQVDGVHTYRIPGLATTNNGSLLAIYDVRYLHNRDLQGHMDIGLSRSTDKGQSWSPMQIVLDMGEWGGLSQQYNGVSDGSVTVDPRTGKIFVTGLWMHGVLDDSGQFIQELSETTPSWNHQWRHRGSQPGFSPKETSQFLITESTDDGKSWSQPRNLTEMVKRPEWWLFAPAPGNGIVMRDGTIVLPTQGRDTTGIPFSCITYSRDGGETWKTTNPSHSNTTECAVVELSDGSLMLNMRDNRNRRERGGSNGRAIFTTKNMGESWTKHPTSNTTLTEPTCMASLISIAADQSIAKRDLLLFSNPNSESKRRDTTIKLSLDQGESWTHELLLDERDNWGYSSLTLVNEHYIGILYESSRAQMTYQLIPIEELLRSKRLN